MTSQQPAARSVAIPSTNARTSVQLAHYRAVAAMAAPACQPRRLRMLAAVLAAIGLSACGGGGSADPCQPDESVAAGPVTVGAPAFVLPAACPVPATTPAKAVAPVPAASSAMPPVGDDGGE